MREHPDGRSPTWETAQWGENPDGSVGQMGKWAHIEKMKPDEKKWTQSGSPRSET